MKVDYRNIVRTLLCTGLLLGTGVWHTRKNQPTQQASPAPDNTKVNERDQNQE